MHNACFYRAMHNNGIKSTVIRHELKPHIKEDSSISHSFFITQQSNHRALQLLFVCHLITVLYTVKPGFHYPSSRTEFTGRVDGP